MIGITPASFSFPSTTVQFWIPARIDPGNAEDYWGGEFVPLVARLRPGVNIEQARNEIHSLAEGIWTLFPWPMPRHWNADSTVISLQADLAGGTRTELFILLGAVGIVLIIACANVASLLLARATARRKEVAMRAALGAGTRRIIRQLLTESLVLALAAGVIGVVLGTTSLSLFRAVVPADIPGMAQVALDWRVCVFAAGLSVLTGLSFGIVPALNAGKLDLVEAVRSGSQRSASKTWIALRSWLIAGEIALTVVLVVGAGLLMKSLYDLTAANPGFNSERILTIKISPNESFCAQRESCIAFYNRLVSQARGLGGVVDAAVANTVPLDGQLPAIPADVEDHPRTADFPSPMLWAGAVTSNYFHLMQIPLISGRAFTEADGTNRFTGDSDFGINSKALLARRQSDWQAHQKNRRDGLEDSDRSGRGCEAIRPGKPLSGLNQRSHVHAVRASRTGQRPDSGGDATVGEDYCDCRTSGGGASPYCGRCRS